MLRGGEWEIDEKVVLKKEKVYVPKDKALRLKVILVAKYRGK